MQVGKTTAADRLVARHGFVKHALADPIKSIARNAFGWDGRKDPAGRRLLQEIGSVGRRYEPRLWLERYAARLEEEPGNRIVVDDVRLGREVRFLRELGFVTVRVVRPAERIEGDPVGRGHETETGLAHVVLDHVLHNDGDLSEFREKVDRLMQDLEGAPGPSRRERGPAHGDAGSRKPKGPASGGAFGH